MTNPIPSFKRSIFFLSAFEFIIFSLAMLYALSITYLFVSEGRMPKALKYVLSRIDVENYKIEKSKITTEMIRVVFINYYNYLN